MAGPQAEVTGPELVQLLHQALHLEGVPQGFQFPRDDWDVIIMDSMGVGSEKSIYTYTRMGVLKGYWVVVEAHGKGGRGHIIYDPQGLATTAQEPLLVAS